MGTINCNYLTSQFKYPTGYYPTNTYWGQSCVQIYFSVCCHYLFPNQILPITDSNLVNLFPYKNGICVWFTPMVCFFSGLNSSPCTVVLLLNPSTPFFYNSWPIIIPHHYQIVDVYRPTLASEGWQHQWVVHIFCDLKTIRDSWIWFYLSFKTNLIIYFELLFIQIMINFFVCAPLICVCVVKPGTCCSSGSLG